MQFVEGLTDRQAAEAIGSRIDWKYVLGLAIYAPVVSHPRFFPITAWLASQKERLYR